MPEITTARADGDAAFGNEFAQAVDGAAHTLLRGVVVRAEGLANFAQTLVLEVAKQDGGAVGIVERVHRFVEQWFDVNPVVRGGVYDIHLGGNLFAQLSASLASNNIDGGAARDLIEPRREDTVVNEAIRVAGKVGEDRLGDLLRQLRRTHLPQRSGMDEVEMAADKFREGILDMMLGIAGEQFQIGVAHFGSISPPSRRIRQGSFIGMFYATSRLTSGIHSKKDQSGNVAQTDGSVYRVFSKAEIQEVFQTANQAGHRIVFP